MITYQELKDASQLFVSIREIKNYITKERFELAAKCEFNITKEKSIERMFGLFCEVPNIIYRIARHDEEIKDELRRGEELSEVENVAQDDNAVLTKENKKSLLIILAAEFMWFMADNGISTFMTNYTLYHLQASTGSNSINTIISGLCSVMGFAIGGFIAARIGRKWTMAIGLGLTAGSYAVWVLLSMLIAPNGSFPVYIFAIFANLMASRSASSTLRMCCSLSISVSWAFT